MEPWTYRRQSSSLIEDEEQQGPTESRLGIPSGPASQRGQHCTEEEAEHPDRHRGPKVDGPQEEVMVADMKRRRRVIM